MRFISDETRVVLRLWSLVFGLGLLWPGVAFASGGGAVEQEDMTLIVGLILGIAVAYLVADFLVDRLQRRFLVVAGVEYIVLGVLLGPVVPQIKALQDLTPLLPIFALAAGWVGLLRGTEARFSKLKAAPAGAGRVVLLHHLVPGVLVGGVAYVAFLYGLHFLPRDAAISAAVLGCCASADSSGPFDLLATRYEIEGTLSSLLRHVSRLGDVLVIFVFGLVFCVFHRTANVEAVATTVASTMDTVTTTVATAANVVTNVPETETLNASAWAWVMLGLGVTLGALFTPFLGGDESDKGRFLALVGIIAFASGAAYFLNLSPIAINLVLGMVLVNFARSGPSIHQTLARTERPMTLVLLVLAGVLWKPSPVFLTIAGIAVFIVLRTSGKWLGNRMAARKTALRSDLYRGLLAHGEVTVAMAISFRLVYGGSSAAVDIAYSVILSSVIFHDLIAPRVLRSLLVDQGDLKGERESALTLTRTKENA